MSISLIISVVMAALKFPAAMTTFIKLLQQTPEEQHAALVAAMQTQAQAQAQSGRPTWG